MTTKQWRRRGGSWPTGYHSEHIYRRKNCNIYFNIDYRFHVGIARSITGSWLSYCVVLFSLLFCLRAKEGIIHIYLLIGKVHHGSIIVDCCFAFFLAIVCRACSCTALCPFGEIGRQYTTLMDLLLFAETGLDFMLSS